MSAKNRLLDKCTGDSGARCYQSCRRLGYNLKETRYIDAPYRNILEISWLLTLFPPTHADMSQTSSDAEQIAEFQAKSVIFIIKIEVIKRRSFQPSRNLHIPFYDW